MKQKHCPVITKKRMKKRKHDTHKTRVTLVQEGLMGLSDKNTGQLIHKSNTYTERYERHTMGLTLK